MSNTVQIKRGAGAPPDNQLAPYELGYDTDGKQLYIGEPIYEDDEIVGTQAYNLGLNGGGSSATSHSGPSFVLVKPDPRTSAAMRQNTTWVQDEFTGERSRVRPRFLKVVFKNLIHGRRYILRLYTQQKHRGRAKEPWRHPLNDPPSPYKNGQCTGYINLAGQTYFYKDQEEGTEIEYVWPDVPNIPDWLQDAFDQSDSETSPKSWMPRSGIIQTEWEFVAESNTEEYDINLSRWCLDLLKPIIFAMGDSVDLEEVGINECEWGLIGVKNYGLASRDFKFGLYDTLTGKEYFGNETLHIGQIKFVPNIPQYKSDQPNEYEYSKEPLATIQFSTIK